MLIFLGENGPFPLCARLNLYKNSKLFTEKNCWINNCRKLADLTLLFAINVVDRARPVTRNKAAVGQFFPCFE